MYMRISYPITDDIYDRVILVKKMKCVKMEGFLLPYVQYELRLLYK